MEIVALLLLIPLFQSGFEASPGVEQETPHLSHLQVVPTAREISGRIHIEPPQDGSLSMRVVRLTSSHASRRPGSIANNNSPEAAQETYTVIVSAP